MENATPMLRQYLEIKKLYPGTLLFFRLGDFYELFNEDAITGSRELQITLTARHKDSPNPIPMCGVPHHAAASYISRLVRKGYRIAICEQAEPATKGTKLVRREVVRVITPGTAVDEQLIDSAESVFLAVVCSEGDTHGAAFLDVSTGTFSATQVTGAGSWEQICELLESFAPREILCPNALARQVRQRFFGSDMTAQLPGMTGDSVSGDASGRAVTELEDHFFDASDAEAVLNKQFRVRALDGFGLTGRTQAIRAAGAALRYAKETQKAAAEHITDISYFESRDAMVLDPVTLRNLEIVDARGETNHTLFHILNNSITSMGSRLLKSWLVRPSIKRAEIQTRQAAVTELADTMLREKIRFLLKKVADLERLIGRLNLNAASARDLLALNQSLSQVPRCKQFFGGRQFPAAAGSERKYFRAARTHKLDRPGDR